MRLRVLLTLHHNGVRLKVLCHTQENRAIMSANPVSWSMIVNILQTCFAEDFISLWSTVQSEKSEQRTSVCRT